MPLGMLARWPLDLKIVGVKYLPIEEIDYLNNNQAFFGIFSETVDDK